MRKNTIVWLMAPYFAVTCLLNEATAANYPPWHDFVTTQSPWITEGGLSADLPVNLSENSRQLIRAIRNASVHGLNPDSYGLSQIMITADALSARDKPLSFNRRRQGTTQPPNSKLLRKSLSARMDLAFAGLATHLGEGVVDARSTQKELFRDAPQINTELLLQSVWSGRQTAIQALESVTPTHVEYQRLTTRMRNLLTERAAGIERPFVADNGTLSASMRHEGVMDIKHRLMDTSDLPPSAALTPRFDSELVSAVRQFQQRYGLEADGTVGRLTRDALNLSIDDEIRAIALSLERWRWMPRELGQKHLYINIPDYRVTFRDGSETKLSLVAVVGAVEHQTPTFSRDMRYMEFNPTWTVPQSIADEELIPKERGKPGYLRSQQFDFFKNIDNRLVPVAPDTVTTADFHSESFPYTLQQRAGGMNDLGRVKFMMPNPYAIYLHDTQAKNHFRLTERAYSHGCIRLSDPDAMVSLLMTEDGYTPDAIYKALQAPQTHRIALRSSIPTHLTYMTTWIDAAGALQRRRDIYQHDAALMIALHDGDTLLSTLNQPTASLVDRSVPVRGKI